MKKISIVGVEGSGKTVLMSVLGDVYSSPDANGLFLNPVNRETFEYCTKTVAEMRQGFWPDVTEPGRTVTLQWRLGKVNNGTTSSELCEVTMMDFAGEVYRQAFGDKSSDESDQTDVERLREYVSQCDGLLLLINLKDVIDGNLAEQRTIDMLWSSKSILDYAMGNEVRGVAIAFTQADRYSRIIEECGGLSGTLKKYLPLINAVYPNIKLFTVSAVGQTVINEKGAEVPAENFVSLGFEDVMMWMTKSASADGRVSGREAETRGSQKIVTALKVGFWTFIFLVSLYNVLQQNESTSTNVWMWGFLIIGAGFFFFRQIIRKSHPLVNDDKCVSPEESAGETPQIEKKVTTPVSSNTATARKKSVKHGDTKKLILPGGAKIEMIYVEPGKFMMGSTRREEGRFNDERQHRVTLTKGFWLGKYPVTQKQWESVMGTNPSQFKGPSRPVDSVSWHDCCEFMGKINRHTDCGARFPTEAEWEYACRAGTLTPYPWGYSCNGNEANCDGNYPCGTTDTGPFKDRTVPTGKYPPNAWGFYDTCGNIYEWCQDWYGAYTGDVVDPQGPTSGDNRVLRGGCWHNLARYCRSANRNGIKPDSRYIHFGFRLACSAKLDE